MKFLVLASNSFTGSHFIDYLMKNTDHSAVGLSRSPEYPDVLLAYNYKTKPKPGRYRFQQMNVNQDLGKILEIVDSEKPDFVVNYSAQGEVRNSWNWPEQWWQTNCMSVVHLTNELVKRKHIKRYLAISTPEVYGSTGLNLKETNRYEPSTPYAASKLAGDLHLQTLQKRYDFPVCFTRAANLYGIHQQLYRIIPRTIIYVKKGKKIQLHGRGQARRSFIHARDVADATYRACMSGKNGEVYHIAPQTEPVSIASLVESICESMGKDFASSVEMMDENFGQDALFSMNSDKIRAELGWSDKVSLEDGIAEMVEWIESNWKEISQLPDEYIHKP
jgi:dTDP-glucose 4,6-dehydratase